MSEAHKYNLRERNKIQRNMYSLIPFIWKSKPESYKESTKAKRKARREKVLGMLSLGASDSFLSWLRW